MQFIKSILQCVSEALSKERSEGFSIKAEGFSIMSIVNVSLKSYVDESWQYCAYFIVTDIHAPFIFPY